MTNKTGFSLGISTPMAVIVLIATLAIIIPYSSAAAVDRTLLSKSCCDDDDEPPPSEHIWFEHVGSTSSTQEEARRIVTNQDFLADTSKTMVCVTATEQTNGRGTSGRAWMGARGNTFVTIAIPQQQWIDTKIPLTLLPLQIGILVARRVQEQMHQCIPSTKTTSTTFESSDELEENGSPSEITKITTTTTAFTKVPPLVTLKWPNVRT
jgi:hypothetical protein